MIRGAELSADRKYRYLLWRIWDESLPTILFIGLNPSTADETQDDATIRRCIFFAKKWGFGELLMANLFAFRATDPAELKEQNDPVGSENDLWIIQADLKSKTTIAAWGTKGSYKERDIRIKKLLRVLWCLGLTKENHPKHPLYLSRETQIIPYWKYKREANKATV